MMFKFYLIIGIIIFVGLAVKVFTNNPSIKEDKKKNLYKYKRKDFLISRAEHEFFDILMEILGNQYHIFTQVHLPTILDHKIPNGQNWKGAFRHIDEKSVDFVICDKAYIKPLLAIELDDKSHDNDDRRQRDEDVEKIFADSNMPLWRFRNHGNFNKEEIKHLIWEKLNQKN